MSDNNADRASRALAALEVYRVDGDSDPEDIFDAVSDVLVDIRHLLDTLDPEAVGFDNVLPTSLSTSGLRMWELLVGGSDGSYSRVNNHYIAEVNGED